MRSVTVAPGLLLMLALASVAAAGGQAGPDEGWELSRTAWGDPDLQGCGPPPP